MKIKLPKREQSFSDLKNKTYFKAMFYTGHKTIKLNIAIFKIQLSLFLQSAKIYIMTLLITQKAEANQWLLVTINYG